jgi:hypothetical protein
VPGALRGIVCSSRNYQQKSSGKKMVPFLTTFGNCLLRKVCVQESSKTADFQTQSS